MTYAKKKSRESDKMSTDEAIFSIQQSQTIKMGTFQQPELAFTVL